MDSVGVNRASPMYVRDDPRAVAGMRPDGNEADVAGTHEPGDLFSQLVNRPPWKEG